MQKPRHLAALALVLVLCVAERGCTSKPPRPPSLPSASEAAAPAVRMLGWGRWFPATARADAPAPAPAVDLGREAGKRSLANAAAAVGWISGTLMLAGVLGLVAGAFFGGIGRRSALMGVAVGLGGFWVRYFILAHGYLVSESLSWIVIFAILVVGPVVGFLALRAHWDGVVARRLAEKRADRGESGLDAISKLAVPQKVRSRLADEWEAIRSGNPVGSSGLLERFRLAIPDEVKR